MKERQQDIEHGHDRDQPGLDVELQAMVNAFEIANDSHHRQGMLSRLLRNGV